MSERRRRDQATLERGAAAPREGAPSKAGAAGAPAPQRANAQRRRIAFLHPELGLGGAERLVVDAAIELKARGHEVVMYTAGHDPRRAFPETVDGRLEVRVHGSFLPARVAGRMQALCTVARVSWAAARLVRERFDVVVCDLVAYPLPLLRLLDGGRARIVYYCHYPDQLLAPPRRGLYRLYRAPLDKLEVPAMRAAHRVVVNSQFTRAALERLGGLRAEVVYPGVDVDAYADVPEPPASGDATLLVVSRFDPRKNLPLVIEALAHLRAHAPDAYARARVVIAGGLDPARPEDVAVARAVEALAVERGVAERLTLRPSPTDAERLALIAGARAVVHAAPDEHFGLVPVEAMAAGRPVVAVAAAGPLETIVDGETGYLCAPTPAAFGAAMARLVREHDTAVRLGRAGRAHAARFSRRAFGDALEAALLGA
jgi:alpha-1,3/alpha-1,6-mannosyltransferase